MLFRSEQVEPLRHNHRKKVGFHQRLHSITIPLRCQEGMNVFLLLTAIDRFWGNCYRRTRRYSLVSGMTAEKSIPLSRISRMISRTAWRCSLSNKKILQARYMIQMLPRAAFAAVPSPLQQKPLMLESSFHT